MSDRDAFLRAIAAAPEDEAPKKVYADWLDDRGEHAEAALYRAWQATGLLLAPLSGYSWEKAFEYAGERGKYAPDGEPNLKPATPEIRVSVAPFSRRHVAEIIAIHEGANDEENWLCVGRLFDGRWFALDAGCDYTGWD